MADSTPAIDAPAAVQLGDTQVSVDTAHEILVNKLCALLGLCELRDLQDVKALVDSGADLERALADGPRKDGGFSRLTLAWVLQGTNLAPLAGAAVGRRKTSTPSLASRRGSLSTSPRPAGRKPLDHGSGGLNRRRACGVEQRSS